MLPNGGESKMIYSGTKLKKTSPKKTNPSCNNFHVMEWGRPKNPEITYTSLGPYSEFHPLKNRPSGMIFFSDHNDGVHPQQHHCIRLVGRFFFSATRVFVKLLATDIS